MKGVSEMDELNMYRALMEKVAECHGVFVSIERCQTCMLPYDITDMNVLDCFIPTCQVLLECENCKGKCKDKCVSCTNYACKVHYSWFLTCIVCNGQCCHVCAGGWPDMNVHVCKKCPLPDSPRERH